MNLKSFIVPTCVVALLVTAGCASKPDRFGRIHLITHEEALANNCTQLAFAGSASGILINGKARNTAVIVKKALQVEGATHISYSKGEAGYAFTRANIWSCPNPNLISSDPTTLKMARKYVGHE